MSVHISSYFQVFFSPCGSWVHPYVEFVFNHPGMAEFDLATPFHHPSCPVLVGGNMSRNTMEHLFDPPKGE
jgi:hypothetical protein